MSAIFKREFGAYFQSPIGYVFLTVFYAFSGYYFFATSLAADLADITGVFYNLFTIIMFLIPILTMRLFSEDKRHKTDQLLLTAPLNLTPLALGKYLAALLVYLMGLAVTLVFGLIVSFFASPNWVLLLGNFVATLLFGMAIIAIGMFISSTTENQVIAAIVTFAVVIFLILVDTLSSLVSAPWLIAVVQGLSFLRRYSNFSTGIFELPSLVFFLSISALFVFLTVRALERRRWG